MLKTVGGLTDDDLRDVQRQIMQDYMDRNTPPEGFYPVVYYMDMFPDMELTKVSAVLIAMVRDGKAERTSKRYIYEKNRVWGYKILMV